MMLIKSLSDQHLKVSFSINKTLQFWIPMGLTICYLLGLPEISLEMIFANACLSLLTICLGHCVGLHRHIVHRSFEARAFMKPVFLLLAALCGFGGPLRWVKFHAVRDYWQCQKNAPKAIRYDNGMMADFFFTLHCKAELASDVHLQMLPEGLVHDKWILFFERWWLVLNLIVAGLFWSLASFDMMIYFVAMRASVGLFFHWLVAYAVHVWGHKAYEIEGVSEEGRNQLVLGWFTFGEAYHNNHHKFPYSASAGLRRVEFDFGYQVIKLLRFLGLAYNVKLAEDHYEVG